MSPLGGVHEQIVSVSVPLQAAQRVTGRMPRICNCWYCKNLFLYKNYFFSGPTRRGRMQSLSLGGGAHVERPSLPSLPTHLPFLPPSLPCPFIYKTAVLVWKCLHDAAPRYLADLCVPAHSVQGRQQLRSTASGTLLVPRARTDTGQRSFAINGPRTWNSLPADLRTPDTTLCSFKRHLKAHLFLQ